MDLAIIHARVDKALRDNRRIERVIIRLSVLIFFLGFLSVVLAYWRLNPYIGSAALLFQGLLYWPIKALLKLRRDNLFLQTVPAMVASLSPENAEVEMKNMLDFLRNL